MKGKFKFLNMLAGLSLMFANAGAGTCCYLVLCQPKMPDRI